MPSAYRRRLSSSFSAKSRASARMTLDPELPPSVAEAVAGIKDSGSQLIINRCQFKRIESMCLSIYQARGRIEGDPAQQLLRSVYARCNTWQEVSLLDSLVLVPDDMQKIEQRCVGLGAPQDFIPSPSDERAEDGAVASAIEKIISTEEYRSQALTLRRRPAEIFVSQLQMTLDKSPTMDSSLREECIKALRKLAAEADVLPANLKIEEVTLSSTYPISSGGFSDVYQGKWQEKLVAVKRPRIFSSDDNAETLKQARREILLWRQLSNEFVLPLLGVFRENGPFYSMVSEWMPNGTLKTFLKQRKHRGLNRLNLIYQMSQGIDYLHKHKPPVAHGDIKADNIFVDSNMRPLLGDFGLSCNHYSIDRTRSSAIEAGTVRWMAPELLCPEKSETGRYAQKPTLESDIWAFAMLMLETFTDADPYEEEPEHIVIMNVTDRRILPARPKSHITERGLTNAVWDLMEECWEYDTKARPKIEYVVRNIQRLSLSIHPTAWDQRTENELVPTALIERVITSDEANWKSLDVKVSKERGNITKDAVQMAVVSITGNAEAVAEARLRISETTEKIGGLSTTDQLRIPKQFHSCIIGQKGCHVKRVELKHGVQIKFPARESLSEEVTIMGSSIGVGGAKVDLEKMMKFEQSSRDVLKISPRAAEIVSERRDDILRPPLREILIDVKTGTVTLRGKREGILSAQTSIQAIEQEAAREVIEEVPVDDFLYELIKSDPQTWVDIVERCDYNSVGNHLKEQRGLLEIFPDRLRLRGAPELVRSLRDEIYELMAVGHACVTGKRFAAVLHQYLWGPQGEFIKDLRRRTGAMVYFPSSGGYTAVGTPNNMDRYEDVDPWDIIKLVGSPNACAKAREYLEDCVGRHREVQNQIYRHPTVLPRVVHGGLDPRFRKSRASVEPETPSTAQSIQSSPSNESDHVATSETSWRTSEQQTTAYLPPTFTGSEHSNPTSRIMRPRYISYASSGTAFTSTPNRMDLHESKAKNEMTATFELPGVKKEDVSIEFRNNCMVVSGESAISDTLGSEGYMVRERRFGQFSKTISLPIGTNSEQIKANMENGVLKVTFPRIQPEQEAKKITIL